MNRLLTILTTLFFMLLVNSCADDFQARSPTSEMHYVDLLYALHHHDQAAAGDAATRFTKSIAGLHAGNYPMWPEKEPEDMRFHLNKAGHTYLEVRTSIEQGELEQAMIQLNRATEELKASRIPGFGELYIAEIHDFLHAWLEVSRTSRKEDLSSREWRAINRRIKAAHIAWRQCEWVRPSPSLYFFSLEEQEEFTLAHTQVNDLMELLKTSLSQSDEVLTKSYVNAVDSSVWTLVCQFGSPEKGGRKPPFSEL